MHCLVLAFVCAKLLAMFVSVPLWERFADSPKLPDPRFSAKFSSELSVRTELAEPNGQFGYGSSSGSGSSSQFEFAVRV
jgi:hypothetical protein